MRAPVAINSKVVGRRSTKVMRDANASANRGHLNARLKPERMGTNIGHSPSYPKAMTTFNVCRYRLALWATA